MPSKPKETRTLPRLGLSLVSVAIGIVAGLGAVVFRALIAFFHNLLFLGKVSGLYDANAHTTPSPWGPFVILVPAIGAAGVVFLVKNFAPEAKGHGVPEVMDAIYYHKGIIRPVVAVVKSLASALSIGSGGSVGREGPIIQIGSVVRIDNRSAADDCPDLAANYLDRRGRRWGIAATFNTPIGGVLFAVGNHDARGQRANAGAGGDRYRDGDLCWAILFWTSLFLCHSSDSNVPDRMGGSTASTFVRGSWIRHGLGVHFVH